ncbi:MAG: hybrid sensor histidine kinase/response regulator [Candidatus Cloacimonetes bacterium]|nr:hybrid sensor histidine kinase/response regulator [Candidatus Cloacimonadota bacterium]
MSAPEPEIQPDTKQGLVLIVDDVPTNLQLLGHLLRENGYDVAFASSGAQALSMVSARKPDVILLDVMMPEMDGYTVCMRLKESLQTRHIPVLFLTAMKAEKDVLKGFECGAVDYVSKPFNSVELLARVKTHVSLKQSKDEILRINAELKASNQAKDRFFSILAHDLRGPFTVFLSMADLLQMQAKNKAWEKMEVSSKNLHSLVKRIYSLLENLLEWGLLQRNRISYNAEILDLDFEIRVVVEQLQDLAGVKSIEIRQQSNKQKVFVDKNLLRAVLRNLISNALKFTHQGGVVTIETSQDEVLPQVQISDTGIGMDESLLQDLFRIDKITTRQGTQDEKGTGLGLILCREYIEKWGGTLRVTSVPSKGSTFSFTLPSGKSV